MKRGGFLHKTLLWGLGLAIVAGGLGWIFVADRLGLARERQMFVGGAATYTVTALYLLQKTLLRRLKGVMTKALAVAMVESPLALFFVLLTFDLLPWPPSMFPYVIGTVLIAPLTVIGVERMFLKGQRGVRDK